MKKSRVIGAVVVGGVLLGGGVAYAAIPASDGVIHGCYTTNGTVIGPVKGSLRVVDEGERCRSNERALPWNQAGPQGVPGPQGPKGDPGDSATNTYGFAHVAADGTHAADRAKNVASTRWLGAGSGEYCVMFTATPKVVLVTPASTTNVDQPSGATTSVVGGTCGVIIHLIAPDGGGGPSDFDIVAYFD